MNKHHDPSLTILDLGIDTHQEPVVYLRDNSYLCRSLGIKASNRVKVLCGRRSIIATLNVVSSELIPEGHLGFSKVALERLDPQPGEKVALTHAPMLSSLSFLRKKIFSQELTDAEIREIVSDISQLKYRDIEIASFLAACANGRLNVKEIIALTKAMVACGRRIEWPTKKRIFDKHCVGGVPGNRTTPLVVSIVSAAGLTIPKTSSRSITSPAGTADTMEVLTTVDISINDIQQVVSECDGCLAWGGAVNLSPADDLLIRIERELDIDGQGQLIASMLSKKIAAGSTHAIIDIPVGTTAKVRTEENANHLAELFYLVGKACGMTLRCVVTDGTKPVGRGIGPAEEAKDILAVLSCDPSAPVDLRDKGILLAAHLLDLDSGIGLEACKQQAAELVDSGAALNQFNRILEAQGGIKTIPNANYKHMQQVDYDCDFTEVDSRKLSRLAKLAGAPNAKAAGIRLHAGVGDRLKAGDPLFELFADTVGELRYALDYYYQNSEMFGLEEL